MGTAHLTWHVGVTSWMIYEDVVQDSVIPFAVEFGWDIARKPYPFARTKDRTKFATYQEECTSRVCGEVIYVDDTSWVLDCGIHVFFKDNPTKDYTPNQEYAVGEYLTGEVLLGVDPRSYKWLKPQPAGMPPVLYDWAIEGGSKQTAPFMEVEEVGSSSHFERDPAKLGDRPVDRAVASHGAGWHDEYILHCSLIGVHNRSGAYVVGGSAISA